MGIKDFQEYLESECPGACVSVDLLKISRGFVSKRRGANYGATGRFCLIVDAESCLDRLYGGYFSDWVCGGQWNRMTAFLTNLIQACHTANMELIVFFDGTLDSDKMSDWMTEQLAQKEKVRLVFRHIHNKGTPPPKVWWSHPVFLRGALRMALRHLGVSVACSTDDHSQEVIGFCREHNLQGIIAQESVYTIFDPPRYFSSNNLKLTYKGSLETKEYIMDEIAKCLNLNPNRFCVFASLLGNHILTDDDLFDFRGQLVAAEGGKALRRNCKLENSTIKSIVDFMRNLPDTNNLDIVGEVLFKSAKNKVDLINRFKQSVQYYTNGTQEGFLKYRPRMKMSVSPRQHGGYPGTQNGHADMSGYGDCLGQYSAPQVVIEPPHHVALGELGRHHRHVYGDPLSMNNRHMQFNGFDPRDKYGPAGGPRRTSPDASVSNKGANDKGPTVTPEIVRIASERHEKGLMSSVIYQLLTQSEIKLPVILEDEANRELPSYVDLYRPIRQTVYSVLFNLNKLKIIHDNQNKDKGAGDATKSFEVKVKEWVLRRGNTRPSFEMVVAKPVEWKTPSIERMWLGQQTDDKNRRLRAFLTCMQSDAPLIMNPNYVPQHLLIMCCVLKYILQFGRVLQRQELDAFLSMAVSPLLHDVQTMQDLKLPTIQPRGVQLASLFMAGVETAIFANDVCGAPIPWAVCCPWLVFDGKLFHFKLLKANNNTPLIDMCDGQVDQVLRVERLRQAIMEGLKIEFAKPMLPNPALYAQYPFAPYPVPYRPGGRGAGLIPGPPMPQKGRGRGLLGRSPIDSRGGQLEIAGVVVGSWGPNLSNNRGGRGRNMGPQVMAITRRGMPGRGYLPTRPLRGRSPALYGMGRGMRPAFTPQGMYAAVARGTGRGFRAVRRAPLRVRPRFSGRGRAGKPMAPTGRGVTVENSYDL